MRLFVALNLPAPVLDALWAAAAPLRDLDLPVKWVRPDGLHLTLKFLGEVPDAQEAELLGALAQAARNGNPGPDRSLALALGGFGAFPDARQPRVVWVGVAPEPALELLQHRVERAFAPLGYPVEGRPFRPHLTLGRATRAARTRDFQGMAEVLGALTFADTALVESVDLMQSTPQRGGAVYQVKRSERLA